MSEAFRDTCSRNSRARACWRGEEEAPLLPGGENGVKFASEGSGRDGVLVRKGLLIKVRSIREFQQGTNLLEISPRSGSSKSLVAPYGLWLPLRLPLPEFNATPGLRLDITRHWTMGEGSRSDQTVVLAVVKVNGPAKRSPT
jgi:hypothetical protein